MHGPPPLLERIAATDVRTANELLAVLYDQLGRAARRQLALEPPGQSLQTADLVHEAYLRLVQSPQRWQGEAHFFAAVAEAMRRILVERARKKRRIKHGGRFRRTELSNAMASPNKSAEEVISVDDLLHRFGEDHPLEAQLVKLHYFIGMNISEAGRVLGISSSTAHRHWTFARAWLHEAIRCDEPCADHV